MNCAGIDAYWQASLYLCMGMLYLRDNPLLREPLKLEHIKPRLLGHWGSDAGQCFTYIHFNRLINKYDLNAIYISGPGHGAPSVLSQAYLEGTYSEMYPDKSEDLAGMQRFFKQFSFPGGIGSHATPETPGSIHEGGELGYSISHAFGTVFDNPDLIALTMVGDGESEKGRCSQRAGTATNSSTRLPTERYCGSYSPQRLQDQQPHYSGPHQPRRAGSAFHRLRVHSLLRGRQRTQQHAQAMAATMEHCVQETHKFQETARQSGKAFRPRWPMIILRSPKGWTAPREVDGHYLEGFWRAHQIPLTNIAGNPAHLELLETWMHSYKPDEHFDEQGRLLPELKALAPKGKGA